MKNKFKRTLFLLIFQILLFLLSISYALANSINIETKTGHIKIQQWIEKDIINNLDLNTDIIYELIIKKNLTTPELLILKFSPGEFVGSKNSGPAKNLRLNGDYSNSAIRISRVKNPISFYDYKIAISEKDLKLKNNTENSIYLKINYSIPNYVSSKKILSFIPLVSDKTVIIGTGCIPRELCPESKLVDRTITLPNEAILQSYIETENILSIGNETLSISPGDNSSVPYKNIILQYKDVNAEKRIFLSGIILATILGLIIQHCYYKKSKKEIDIEISGLKQKLENKLSSNNFNKKYEFINEKLNKLVNLMNTRKKYKKSKK